MPAQPPSQSSFKFFVTTNVCCSIISIQTMVGTKMTENRIKLLIDPRALKTKNPKPEDVFWYKHGYFWKERHPKNVRSFFVPKGS